MRLLNIKVFAQIKQDALFNQRTYTKGLDNSIGVGVAAIWRGFVRTQGCTINTVKVRIRESQKSL